MTSFALSERQAQDIRFSKAKLYLVQNQESKAMALFKKILSGPFHYDAEIFLARYFYEQKVFTKSFRLYQHILKEQFNKAIVNHPYSHKNRSKFDTVLKKINRPSPRTLSTIFELAEKYFEAYTFRYLPEEFQKSILNLSQKYFHISDFFNIHPATTKFYLSKIYLIRKDNNGAIQKLKETQEAFTKAPDRAMEMGLKEEDIKVHLAEAFAKEGFEDSSTLILLGLRSRENLSQQNRHYVSNYLKQLRKSFIRTTFSYMIKSKGNINQLGSEDYENFDQLENQNDLGKKDSLAHSGRFHLYYHRRIDDNKDFSLNGTYQKETPLSSNVEKPASDQYTLDANFKFHSTDNRFWSLSYQYSGLSGRELDTLINFQAKSKHTFSASHIWVDHLSKWILTVPLEKRTTQTNRSTTSLATSLEYIPYIRMSWLNPSIYGSLGRRSEGEELESSFFVQLGAENTYKIKDIVLWSLGADYYLNSNSSQLINYSEFSLSNNFRYALKDYPGFVVDGEVLWRNRSNDIVGSIQTFDLGVGITYSF